MSRNKFRVPVAHSREQTSIHKSSSADLDTNLDGPGNVIVDNTAGRSLLADFEYADEDSNPFSKYVRLAKDDPTLIAAQISVAFYTPTRKTTKFNFDAIDALNAQEEQTASSPVPEDPFGSENTDKSGDCGPHYHVSVAPSAVQIEQENTISCKTDSEELSSPNVAHHRALLELAASLDSLDGEVPLVMSPLNTDKAAPLPSFVESKARMFQRHKSEEVSPGKPAANLHQLSRRYSTGSNASLEDNSIVVQRLKSIERRINASHSQKSAVPPAHGSSVPSTTRPVSIAGAKSAITVDASALHQSTLTEAQRAAAIVLAAAAADSDMEQPIIKPHRETEAERAAALMQAAASAVAEQPASPEKATRPTEAELFAALVEQVKQAELQRREETQAAEDHLMDPLGMLTDDDIAIAAENMQNRPGRKSIVAERLKAFQREDGGSDEQRRAIARRKSFGGVSAQDDSLVAQRLREIEKRLFPAKAEPEVPQRPIIRPAIASRRSLSPVPVNRPRNAAAPVMRTAVDASALQTESETAKAAAILRAAAAIATQNKSPEPLVEVDKEAVETAPGDSHLVIQRRLALERRLSGNFYDDLKDNDALSKSPQSSAFVMFRRKGIEDGLLPSGEEVEQAPRRKSRLVPALKPSSATASPGRVAADQWFDDDQEDEEEFRPSILEISPASSSIRNGPHIYSPSTTNNNNNFLDDFGAEDTIEESEEDTRSPMLDVTPSSAHRYLPAAMQMSPVNVISTSPQHLSTKGLVIARNQGSREDEYGNLYDKDYGLSREEIEMNDILALLSPASTPVLDQSIDKSEYASEIEYQHYNPQSVVAAADENEQSFLSDTGGVIDESYADDSDVSFFFGDQSASSPSLAPSIQSNSQMKDDGEEEETGREEGDFVGDSVEEDVVPRAVDELTSDESLSINSLSGTPLDVLQDYPSPVILKSPPLRITLQTPTSTISNATVPPLSDITPTHETPTHLNLSGSAPAPASASVSSPTLASSQAQTFASSASPPRTTTSNASRLQTTNVHATLSSAIPFDATSQQIAASSNTIAVTPPINNQGLASNSTTAPTIAATAALATATATTGTTPSKTISCRSCGYLAPESSKFCGECGSRLHGIQPSTLTARDLHAAGNANPQTKVRFTPSVVSSASTVANTRRLRDVSGDVRLLSHRRHVAEDVEMSPSVIDTMSTVAQIGHQPVSNINRRKLFALPEDEEAAEDNNAADSSFEAIELDEGEAEAFFKGGEASCTMGGLFESMLRVAALGLEGAGLVHDDSSTAVQNSTTKEFSKPASAQTASRVQGNTHAARAKPIIPPSPIYPSRDAALNSAKPAIKAKKELSSSSFSNHNSPPGKMLRASHSSDSTDSTGSGHLGNSKAKVASNPVGLKQQEQGPILSYDSQTNSFWDFTTSLFG